MFNCKLPTHSPLPSNLVTANPWWRWFPIAKFGKHSFELKSSLVEDCWQKEHYEISDRVWSGAQQELMGYFLHMLFLQKEIFCKEWFWNPFQSHSSLSPSPLLTMLLKEENKVDGILLPREYKALVIFLHSSQSLTEKWYI